MHKVKGIKDFMKRERFEPRHISKAFMDKNVPGNWESYMNIYNLVNGNSVPRDAYVYIVLAELLNVDLKIILMRYSDVTMTEEESKSNAVSQGMDWDDLF